MAFRLVTHDGEVACGEITEADASNLWLVTPEGVEVFEWAEVRSLESID